MKFLINKIYIILFLLAIFLMQSEVSARDNKIQYTRENISNYFFGIISANKHFNNRAFKHLKKVQSLRNKHSQFNINLLELSFYFKNLSKHLLFQEVYGLKMNSFLKLIFY